MALHADSKGGKGGGSQRKFRAADLPRTVLSSAENAMAERLNGILKQEYGLDETFATRAEARQASAQAILLYNTRRPHTALGLATPEAVHNAQIN